MIVYAQPIVAELRANMVRVDADFSVTPFKAKISNAELDWKFPASSRRRLHAGNFPIWLAPDRVDANFSATPFKAKISNAEQLRVHTMLVIGGRDVEAGAVSVRLHHGGPQGAKPKAEVIAGILAAIRERRA